MAIHQAIPPRQKKFTIRRPSSFTRRRWIRVAPIVQNSPLLPPVGVWPVSQCQCGRLPFQAGYPSTAWWAVTPPTTMIGLGLLFKCPLRSFDPLAMRPCGLMGYQPAFRQVVPLSKVDCPSITHPSAAISDGTLSNIARLACVKHAASVHSEPGSNSPLNFYRTLEQKERCF